MERCLVEKLGANGVCPHGNQINKNAVERRKHGLQPLWEASPGSLVKIDSMYERDRKLLEYFDGLGIRPGVELKVLSHNYDGTLTLRLRNTTFNLGEAAAAKFWVSRVARESKTTS
jgi:Fe2+ transport system protein FeoA